MSDERFGAWDPLTPTAVAELLESCPAPWWIAGGYAIDALVGKLDRRPHGDIDVGLLARDQEVIRSALKGWDLHCADPPGDLRPWLDDEVLENRSTMCGRAKIPKDLGDFSSCSTLPSMTIGSIDAIRGFAGVSRRSRGARTEFRISPPRFSFCSSPRPYARKTTATLRTACLS